MVDHSFFALSNTYVLMKVVSKHFFISTAPKSNNKRTKVYSYVYNVSKASKNLFGTILQRKKPNQFFFFLFFLQNLFISIHLVLVQSFLIQLFKFNNMCQNVFKYSFGGVDTSEVGNVLGDS